MSAQTTNLAHSFAHAVFPTSPAPAGPQGDQLVCHLVRPLQDGCPLGRAAQRGEPRGRLLPDRCGRLCRCGQRGRSQLHAQSVGGVRPSLSLRLRPGVPFGLITLWFLSTPQLSTSLPTTRSWISRLAPIPIPSCRSSRSSPLKPETIPVLPPCPYLRPYPFRLLFSASLSSASGAITSVWKQDLTCRPSDQRFSANSETDETNSNCPQQDHNLFRRKISIENTFCYCGSICSTRSLQSKLGLVPM